MAVAKPSAAVAVLRWLGSLSAAIVLSFAIPAMSGGEAEAQQWRPRKPPASGKLDPGAVKQARRHWLSGVRLTKNEANPAAALVEFRRAYQLAPHHKILFNIAEVSRILHEYPDALAAYEAYLRWGGPRVPAARRTAVRAAIAELRGYVATLTIETSVEGVRVTIDGHPAGRTPLRAPIIVKVGRRVLEFDRGTWSDRRVVAVAGGDRRLVKVDVTATAVAPPPDPGTKRPFWPWRGGALVATGVSVTAATVLGLMAMSAQDEVATTPYSGPTVPAGLIDKQRSANNLALATDVALAAAVAGGAASLWLWLRERPSGQAATTETGSDSGAFTWSLHLNRGPSLQYSRSF